MFDLNDDKQFGGAPQIFNEGVAGLVDNVTISVEKKEAGEPDNYPDYKLIVKDKAGNTVNQGFYYFTPNQANDDDYNTKRETQEVGRVLHIARAVMGEDYQFPSVNSSKEAFDVLFKLVKDNAANKSFNVYATYGTVVRPSGFIGLRYFNFIEPAGASPSRLTSNKNDNMERVVADEDSKPQEQNTQAVEKW